MKDAPIVQKVYDFYREFYKLYPHIPKQDRYVLGEKIQEATLELFEDLISASHQEKQKKLEYLSKAATKLDLLKNLLRLAEDRPVISISTLPGGKRHFNVHTEIS